MKHADFAQITSHCQLTHDLLPLPVRKTDDPCFHGEELGMNAFLL